MTTDLILFLAGMAGALINRMAGANPTRSWATVAEVVSAGGAMVAINAAGLIPAELSTAMAANPLRVGIFAGLAGLLMGPGLVTLAKSTFLRVTNGKPEAKP